MSGQRYTPEFKDEAVLPPNDWRLRSGSSLKSLVCSSRDIGLDLRASVTLSSVIFGGRSNQVRPQSSSHSEAARFSMRPTTPKARLIVSVFLP
jgi:hypothetical protein